MSMITRQKERIAPDNISAMFSSTSIAMIFTELTGVIALLIDGIVTSRFLGSDAYSGISLLRPFSSIVLLCAGFLSTGCTVSCSKLVGLGKRDDANEVFNLVVFLSILLSAILLVACIIAPPRILELCGVKLTKLPELNPYMYSYLRGYQIGIPAMVLCQILGPIVVMDSNKRLFTISSIVLCVSDILGDLVNVLVFHGGAFGIGVATSVGYILQWLVLSVHFFRSDHYFHYSLRLFNFRQSRDVFRNGLPALVKKFATVLRDILTNRLNLMVALTTAAIAAKGVQGDLQQFLYCIPTGIGRTLITMAGVYYGSNDLQGLKRLFSYAMKFGILLTASVSLATFLAAPMLSGVYTDDASVMEFSTFSIRWLAISLTAVSIIGMYQHYIQGIHHQKVANALSFAERFIFPVATAFILSTRFGSKGILASNAISEIFVVLALFVYICVHTGGIPKRWEDFMLLPEEFGGNESDNLYTVIRSREDVIRSSEETAAFCLSHGAGGRKAMLMALFVEEMAINIVEHPAEKGDGSIRADFRLHVDGAQVTLTLRDLRDHFDPTGFYELNNARDPESHIGIRMVMEMATEVRYFSAFDSNNLMVRLK